MIEKCGTNCINAILSGVWGRKKFLKVQRASLMEICEQIIDVSNVWNGFKPSIRKSKADLEAFCFNKEVAMVTMKSKGFNFF